MATGALHQELRRLGRYPVIVVDLRQPRDYADMPGAISRKPFGRAGFWDGDVARLSA